jgi:hypothetical protein
MAGFRKVFHRQSTEDAVTTVNVSSEESKTEYDRKATAESDNASSENAVNEKGAVDTENPVVSEPEHQGPVFEAPDENTQRGVADMEAMTQTWSRRSLIAVFVKYVLLSHFYMISFILIFAQHLAAILYQCLPKLRPEQPDSLPDK